MVNEALILGPLSAALGLKQVAPFPPHLWVFLLPHSFLLNPFFVSASSHDLKPGNDVLVNPLGMGNFACGICGQEGLGIPRVLFRGSGRERTSAKAGQSWGMWVGNGAAPPASSSKAGKAKLHLLHSPGQVHLQLQLCPSLAGLPWQGTDVAADVPGAPWGGEHHEADTWQG